MIPFTVTEKLFSFITLKITVYGMKIINKALSKAIVIVLSTYFYVF